jgi:bacteriocin biosynthesis cyclodehydratase domain-containing protein
VATTLRVISAGAFGAAVAAVLAGSAGPAVGAADQAGDGPGPDGAAGGGATGVLVAALWRPCPALCEELDAQAFADGVPWLPIVAEHPHVLAGPLVVPPSGPCFRCYCDRRAQHDSRPEVTAGLLAAYDADPGLGPAGYLPHHVRIAAALAELVLLDGVPGRIAAHNVHTGQTTRQHVTGVHGCARCDPGAEMGPRDGSSLAGYVRA